MKKSYIIGLCAVLMVAIVGCESKDVGTVSSPDSSVTESQPNETQIKFDEERETIKDEAIEADIIQIASGEWEGKKVYGQGQVGLVKESDGEVTFMLVDFSDSSMSGFPVTADANLNKSFLKISNGDMVKIYGTVMPEKNSTSRVFALLIETLEETESQEISSSQPTAEDDLSEKNQGENVFKGASIPDNEITKKNYGEDTISQIMALGFTIEETSEIQQILLKVGVNSLSDIEKAIGTGIDELQSFTAIANGNSEQKFFFTVENRKMFYAGFRDADLYDIDQGGFLININDVHIPETNITTQEYSKLQIMAEDEIRLHLNYPDSAKFPMYDGWGAGRADETYKVGGYVKASNAFGVMDEVDFSVYFEKSQTGAFTVTAVVMDGNRIK